MQCYTSGDRFDDYKNKPLFVYVTNTNNDIIVSATYYNPAPDAQGTSGIVPPSGEVTGSINISNVNNVGYIVVEMYDHYKKSGAFSQGANHVAFLHRLWFT